MYIYVMRKVNVNGNKLEVMDDKIETLFQKKVTRFGNGAKVDCPKKYIGAEAYVIVRKKR